jgi:predicted ATPase
MAGNTYMRFPGGRHKALTLSYDDGVEQDIRLIGIMKANGLKGNFNIVFTSNKHPSHWRTNFNEHDALLCALERIFDDATVFNIKGESFRGKKLETVALQTSRVKAPTSSETPTP